MLQGSIVLGQSGGVSFADVTLTPTQILNLHTTPVEVIPAPGAGKFILFAPRGAFGQLLGNTSYNNDLNIAAYFDGIIPTLQFSYFRKIGMWDFQNLSGFPNYTFRSQSNIGYSAYGVSGLANPTAIFENKAVMMWNYNSSSITPPNVGNQTFTTTLFYTIEDIQTYTPIPEVTVTDIKVTSNGGTYTPLDGTETSWAASVLYSDTVGNMIPSFVLNPVYEGAGVWNLGQYTGYNFAGTRGFSLAASCVKSGNKGCNGSNNLARTGNALSFALPFNSI